MSDIKRYRTKDVFTASRERISWMMDHFERVYVSFSGGKDSTVMLHMVMDEAIKRNRKIGILLIDLEAQYKATMDHVAGMFKRYHEHAEIFWVCLPIKLRNAVSQYEPVWCAWDSDARAAWVREIPDYPDWVVSDPAFFPFFVPRMEFEEFDVLFGVWYARGKNTAACIGIRADESLNRFRTITSKAKETFRGAQFTTKIADNLYNIYPVYDWKTQDIWTYHGKNPGKESNSLYDQMHLAGLTIHQMRICQPYGDDQRRGLWLYHLIEPQSWFKVVARVNGANSGSLYIQETGNVTGYNHISKPPGHTWESFFKLLMASLPKATRDHYRPRFRVFVNGWLKRGYAKKGLPQEAPRILESKHWAPSWRRMCKVLLRNDWWCKGLGLTQPKSAAYQRYMDLVRQRKRAES